MTRLRRHVRRFGRVSAGPPYDDPLINQLAFYVFIVAALALVALSVIAVVRQIRIRLQLRHRSD